MIPQIDKQIGISVYSTKYQGIGGKIRVEPEDFQVKERISEKIEKNISQQDGYSVYKLTKKILIQIMHYLKFLELKVSD